MYESQFLLKRRPFAATPDPRCFLAAGSIQAALDELVVCVEQGQGIAVVSAPAGVGKTLLCERLGTELKSHFEIVFLRHASFPTRRALLQTILAEMNHAYQRQDEQELRLELVPAIRALNPSRDALVLICDEAHGLGEDLLEELRILSDLAENGRPLVRLVLVGQPGLEETLARPGLEALNQRIRAHVCLESFNRLSSLDYIDYRITWAGGRTDEVFTPEALELICRASQGMPRCINQLCDHALLLAYVSEQKPVSAETIREALQDLRQLPLHWNESLTEVASVSRTTEDFDLVEASTPAGTAHLETSPSRVTETSLQFQSVEFGADLPMIEAMVESSGSDLSAATFECGIPDIDELVGDTFADEDCAESEIADDTDLADDQPPSVRSFMNTVPPRSVVKPSLVTSPQPVIRPTAGIRRGEVVEEIVWDRYAAIDGGFPIPEATALEAAALKITAPEITASLSEPVPDARQTVAAAAGNECDTRVSDQVHGDATVFEVNSAPDQTCSAECPAQSRGNRVSDTPNSVDDGFDAVCTRLDERLPEVRENPGWDAASLEFGNVEERLEATLVDADRGNSSDDWDSLEAELGMAVCELTSDVRAETKTPNDGHSAFERLQEILGTARPDSSVIEADSSSIEFGSDSAPSRQSSEPRDDASPRTVSADSSARPYRNLFSQLRRKQQGLL